ncbi:fibronectin type III domain-containing protein, partial [Pseudomonas aeruginosa]|uniref:fibronectin type III domain-containing protein n=1 Tax=Pseudomonas aeruginosa TaxID=287 RepID=UPI0034573DD7
IGTSTPSAASAAVVPYALSAAPSTPSVTAGTLSATLTWTAPNNSGSTITGYRITPYLAGVAQTVQTFNGGATTQLLTGLT